MSFRFEVTASLVGKRLDSAIAELEPDLSRSRIRRLVEQGAFTVGGSVSKPAHRLRLGEEIRGCVPPPEPDRLEPEAIPLDVVFEDADVIVVDKPPGLVVHPSPGHRSGTLVHALLHHCSELSGVGGVQRPGIVHRLDKDTSGLIVSAKNDRAHRGLARQFQAHSIDREYLALVRGRPTASAGTVDAAIGRHPSDRKRFSTRVGRGRRAVTHWSVVERFEHASLLRVSLETGRTHQIRVHLAASGLPVAGDPLYGGGKRITRALGLERQALHAARLGFDHPQTGARVVFESPLPDDLSAVLESLRL